MKIEVGDTVEIVNDNHFWNGTIARVRSVGVDPAYPYELVVVTPTAAGHRKVGENIGGWGAGHVKLCRDLSRQGRFIAEQFPNRLDIYYSEVTDGAVVLDGDGTLHRVFADGTVDKPYTNG